MLESAQYNAVIAISEAIQGINTVTLSGIEIRVLGK